MPETGVEETGQDDLDSVMHEKGDVSDWLGDAPEDIEYFIMDLFRSCRGDSVTKVVQQAGFR